MSSEAASNEVSLGESAEVLASSTPATPAPTTPQDESASKRATRALELAGRAMDPTAGGPDRELARLLFREAIVRASGKSTWEEAIEHLEERGVLGRDTKACAETRALLAKLDVTPALQDLDSLELPIAKLVEAALGRKSLEKAARLRRRALLTLAGMAALSVPVFTYFRFASDSFRYRASSAHKGFPSEGYIGRIYAFGLVVHTQQQREPWIEIDLEELRAIHRITLKNRADCCHDRGLPLVVETATEDKVWVEVARRDKAFDRLDLHFPERQARWIRIRSTANTVLHFREIKVK